MWWTGIPSGVNKLFDPDHEDDQMSESVLRDKQEHSKAF